jgi:DNA-binding SARP family transcriptional activator
MDNARGHAGHRDGSLVDRTRLLDHLNAEPAAPITILTAGAGFGKSVLAGQWLAGQAPVWLDLSDRDVEMGAFVGRLADRWRRSGADEATADRLEAITLRGDDADSETRARLVADALEADRGGRDGLRWIVLDDVHELGEGPAAALIGGLVRQLPLTVRLLLTTRTELPFATQRMRARGLIREVTARDLAFVPDELGRVLSASLGPEGARLTGEVLDLTAGWPALVRLIVEALRPLPADRWAALLAAEGHRTGGSFSYLAEEVLAREPAGLVEVIRTLAPLAAIDAGLCAELGLPLGEAVLDDLDRRGLFVRRDGGERRWVLHGLIREYAMDRLPLPEDRRRAVWHAAVAVHARTGRPDEALRAAIASEDPDLIEPLLRASAPDLLSRGHAALVLAAIERLPPSSIGPETAIVLGDAHAFQGRADAALAAYAQAAGGRGADRESTAPLPAAVAWRVARVQFDRGEPAAAWSTLARVDPGADGRDAALALAYRALYGYLTHEIDAGPAAEAAVTVAESSGDAHARSVAHTAAAFALREASPAAGRRHHLAALEAAEQAGDIVQIVRLRNADDDLPTLDLQFAQASSSLELIEAAGNPVWLVRTLMNRGLIALDQGRFDIAESDLGRARQQAAAIGPEVEILPLAFEAELARIRGDIGQAILGFEAAIQRADAASDTRTGAYARAGLGRLLARTDPARARELSDRAIAESIEHDRVDHVLSGAWIAACQDRTAEARELAQTAIAACGVAPGRSVALGSAMELLALLSDDVSRGVAGLEEAAGIWDRIGNAAAAAANRLARAVLEDGPTGDAATAARAALRAAGVRPAAASGAGILALIPTAGGAGLSVRILGAFAVVRGGRPVPIGEWKSRKARDLLKILVSRRGSPIARDELIDLLWPDADPAATANQLSVALSLLRRVLDPQRSGRVDQFVAADRQAVALRLETLEVDLEAFVTEARDGLDRLAGGRADEAERTLARAEARYAGDAFPEDPYSEWAIAVREEARGLYVRVASGLASLAMDRGDPGFAARTLRRALVVEPYDEEAHLGLARALATAGRRPDARRAYQDYVGRMAELGVEPAPYPGAA